MKAYTEGKMRALQTTRQRFKSQDNYTNVAKRNAANWMDKADSDDTLKSAVKQMVGDSSSSASTIGPKIQLLLSKWNFDYIWKATA